MDGRLLKENLLSVANGRRRGGCPDCCLARCQGKNRTVWNKFSAAAAASDVCEGQETVGGLQLGLQRWMKEEILTKTAPALVQNYATVSESTCALMMLILFLLTHQHYHYQCVVIIQLQRGQRGVCVPASCLPVPEVRGAYSLTSRYT